MDFENLIAATNIRTVEDDLAIESPRAQQSRIEYVGTVRRRNDDHVRRAVKTVHLDKDLIQGLFALVVTAAEARATLPANGIDFVDEDDTR